MKKVGIFCSILLLVVLGWYTNDKACAKEYNVQAGHWWDVKRISLKKLFRYKEMELNVSNIKPNLHSHWPSSVVIEIINEEYRDKKKKEVTRVKHRISYLIGKKDRTIYKLIHEKSQDRYNFEVQKIIERLPSQILKTFDYNQNQIIFNLKPNKPNKVISIFVGSDELNTIGFGDNLNKGELYLRLVGINADVRVKYIRK